MFSTFSVSFRIIFNRLIWCKNDFAASITHKHKPYFTIHIFVRANDFVISIITTNHTFNSFKYLRLFILQNFFSLLFLDSLFLFFLTFASLNQFRPLISTANHCAVNNFATFGTFKCYYLATNIKIILYIRNLIYSVHSAYMFTVFI